MFWKSRNFLFLNFLLEWRFKGVTWPGIILMDYFRDMRCLVFKSTSVLYLMCLALASKEQIRLSWKHCYWHRNTNLIICNPYKGSFLDEKSKVRLRSTSVCHQAVWYRNKCRGAVSGLGCWLFFLFLEWNWLLNCRLQSCAGYDDLSLKDNFVPL